MAVGDEGADPLGCMEYCNLELDDGFTMFMHSPHRGCLRSPMGKSLPVTYTSWFPYRNL